MRKKLAALFIIIGLAVAGWSGFAWAKESSSGESIGENDIVATEENASAVNEHSEENNNQEIPNENNLTSSDEGNIISEENEAAVSEEEEDTASEENETPVPENEENTASEGNETSVPENEENTANEGNEAAVPANEEMDAEENEEVEPRDYEEYKNGDEIGWLLIPSLDMKYPIYWGTDDETLKQGVGYHEGDFTVPPDGLRHTVLSGHRDTVFRELGDLEEGESMYIQFEDVQYEYEIQKTWITDKDDRTVIVDKDEPVLTLTTCYPFGFLGAAPDRYIIEAPLVETTQMD